MTGKLAYSIKKGAARVILCSALAIIAVPVTTHASSGDSGRLLEAQFEDAEGFRLFKYRTLKALNELRDLGLTPQAIVETLQGLTGGNEAPDSGAEDAKDAAGNDLYEDLTQGLSDAFQEQTQALSEEASDALKTFGDEAVNQATDAARQQMGGAAQNLGRSIGQFLRGLVDSVTGDGSSD